MEIQLIADPTILNPKSNLIYHLKCSDIPQGYIEIHLIGEKLANVTSVNVYSHDFIKNNKCYKWHKWEEAESYESIESLPSEFKQEKLPPLLRRKQKGTENGLYYVKKITFDTDSNATYEELSALPYPLHLYNDAIQKDCQAILKDIPVQKPKSSLYKPANLPSREFLHHFYQQFWSLNKDRLLGQKLISENYCHIRAHFVCTFLSVYGIDSIKIFKLWDKSDWQKEFPGKAPIHFHCATLILDKEQNKWIWDMLEYLSDNLWTLEAWANENKSPKPRAIVLANRSVIDDKREGTIQWLNFETSARPPSKYGEIFQELFVKTIFPNIPVQIRQNPNHFFKAEKSFEQDSAQNSLVI